MSDDYDRQSARAALKDILGMALALTSLAAVACLLGSLVPGAGDALRIFVAGGKLLTEHLGWTISIYVATLLALYAIVHGKQYAGKVEDGPQFRQRLGSLAEFLAASALTYLGFVLAYLISAPQMLLTLVAILPMVGIILSLSAHLGTFATLSRTSRYLDSLQMRSRALAQLKKLATRSSVRALWVLIANVFGIAAVASMLSLGFLPETQRYLVIYLLGLYLLTGAGALIFLSTALYSGWASREAFLRVALWSVPVAYYLFVGLLSWNLFEASSASTSVWFLGVMMCLVLLLSAATTFVSRSRVPRAVMNWTVRGAVASLAARSLQKEAAKALLRIQQLTEKVPERTSVESWLLGGAGKYQTEPLAPTPSSATLSYSA